MSTTLGWVGSELRTLLVRVRVAAASETLIVLVVLAAEMSTSRAVVALPAAVYSSVPPASASVPEGPRLLVPESAIAETASVPAEIVVPPVKGLAPESVVDAGCRPGSTGARAGDHVGQTGRDPASVRSKARVGAGSHADRPAAERARRCRRSPTRSVRAETVGGAGVGVAAEGPGGGARARSSPSGAVPGAVRRSRRHTRSWRRPRRR